MVYSYYVGNITISNPITYLNSVLTCISTGGPATTVIWTRKSRDDVVTMVNNGPQVSVLYNSLSGQYIHTLRVSQTDMVVYECFVSNNKPSSAKAAVTFNRDGMHVFIHTVVIDSFHKNLYVGLLTTDDICIVLIAH